MKRGDVFWADLAPRSGPEQRGRRPVIIVSHDGFNVTPGWRSVIVVPLSTSAKQAQGGPTAVPLIAGTSGLRSSGFALCHQVTALDRATLAERIGALSQATLARIETGLKAALDIE